MDTLTHALSGALVARLLHTRTPQPQGAQPSEGTPTALPLWAFVTVGTVAGAFPDVDIVARWWGDVAYLLNHRGVTHSLLLAPIWAALVAWLMAQFLPATRGRTDAWRAFYGVAIGGILVHIAGDWITQFGTMLWSPWSNARHGLGSVFIIDLWFTGALVLGLVLAAVWRQRRWPAALGLALACTWVVVTWVGQQEALAAGHQQARQLNAPDAQVVVMPRPASPFNWTVAVLHEGQYHIAHLNTRRTAPLALTTDSHWIRRMSAAYMPTAQATWSTLPQWGPAGTPAWVQEAWAHPAFAFYRWFAEVPALTHHHTTRLPDGRVERCAWFQDLRFGMPGREGTPFHYGVCLLGNDETSTSEGRVYRLQGQARHPV